MSFQMSTKEKLLSIIDDIELIAKEIIENAIAPKHLKLSGPEYTQLTDLLIAKNNELNDTLKLAAEQAEIDKKMDVLKAEVDRQDQDINSLQRQFKEAEQILATAIYQANQKLQSISRANKKPVSSEELIKFAHRISASNAVCAPLTWQQGDPRRPYPTDIEMRLGLLGRLMNNDPVNGGQHLLQQQQQQQHTNNSSAGGNMATSSSSAAASSGGVVAAPSENLHGGGGIRGGATGGHPNDNIPAAQQNQFSWHPSGEIHMSVPGAQGGGTVAMDTRNHHHKQENEDVEVMSTDSSSSSSSDSQ